jgi:predicted nucleic acid-binding protein
LSLYVIDASVAVQWFLPEPQSEAANRLRNKGNQLYVPRLFFLELDNVILKHVRRKRLSPAAAGHIRSALGQNPFRIHSDETLRDGAFDVAGKSGCSLYDALYLALAVNLGEQLVTADRRLYNGLTSGPFTRHILWVEDLPKF